MALQIPHAGLQLEEDFVTSHNHLPTQAFILDLSDDVIEGMIKSASQGQEIRLSLGNKPTFLYGASSHHIEPTFEDETDDIELFLTNASDSPSKAERLPQLAMSLFRKPELGNPWAAQYRTSSSEDEDGEYDELVSSPEPEDDAEQRSYDDLNTDIALLRNSLAQKEAEKLEKSTRVIEGSAPAPNGKSNSKRTAGSLQKALSGRRSPFGRTSLSPLPTSPALSAIGSPSLGPADGSSQQAAEKAKEARSPIIHELAFKEQSYDILWQKYPGSSEIEFKSALEKVADLDDETHNYVLRKKYWKELDVWHHDYASDEERQQAIDNAIRQFDKMRLSTTEPEWEKLLPKEERGQGRILSKIQVSIAKGTAAPRIRVQRPDEPSADSASGRDDSAENGSGSNRTDEEGADSEAALSSSRQQHAAAKKKMTALKAQEKRLLSTKKKNTPASSSAASSSIKVSPSKANAKANNEKQTKFKSKEFVTDSDTSDGESESAPLSTTVQQPKPAATNGRPAAAAAKSAAAPVAATPPAAKERARKEATPTTLIEAKKAKPSPLKEQVRPQITAKPLPKKRVREYDDDDSSSSSSSGTPLSKRLKPLKPPPKALPVKERDRRQQQNLPQPQPSQPSQPSQLSQSSRPPSSSRVSNISPNSSSSNGGSSSGGGSGNTLGGNGNSTTNGTSTWSKPKNNNTSPVKSSPLASSPPTNASELDLSSEESVPPIGSSNTAKKRKMVEDRRNNLIAGETSSSNSKIKKRRHLPDDLVDKALRFKAHYEKYEALYKDIASRADPPKDKVAELLKLHNRLQDMKNDIHNQALLRAT